MVRATSPQVRAFHVHGVSDAEGFAAMGVAETLVHMHDVTQGLRLAWNPPADLCARVLARLFPHAPMTTSPWSALLWATGRGDFPGLSRLTEWRWYAAPRPLMQVRGRLGAHWPVYAADLDRVPS
jgi:hypothetical protein